MPTKILVVETPSFQLGANAGETAERIAPEAFAARHAQHVSAGGTDTLFVLAPSELRHQNAFAEAANGDSSLSLCFFSGVNDALRFLPTLLLFAGGDRAQGVKCYLQKQSTIYTEALFGAAGVGTKLDPCFTFARSRLSAETATNAWACIQALAFLGIQNLPEQGEKGTGEKVDLQLGADEKFLAFTVHFSAPKERLISLRSSAILTLPRFTAGVIETRYVESASQIEFTCLFFRHPGLECTIEIVTYNRRAELENAEDVKGMTYKSFTALSADAPAPASLKKPAGGFKKKFSDQVKVVGGSSPADELILVKGGPREAETSTMVKGSAGGPEGIATVSADAPAPYAPTLVISGSASLVPEKETVFKNENAANRAIELEAKVKSLENSLKVAQDALAKQSKEDPLAKRDVLTNIKDGQSEGLKQNIKLLEEELKECKDREKELMKMVDKAVQMKDEAAKRIKELDVKLKAASNNGGGSKVQMLEKALDEQKRQNKELSKKVSDLSDKLKAA